jgi:ABC-type glycerol-3-phosphate transport system substrate-binding protein
MVLMLAVVSMSVFGAGQTEAPPAAPVSTELTGELRVGAQAWMLEKFQLDDAAKKFMVNHPAVKTSITKVELADTTSYILQWSSGKTNVDIALGGSREQAVQYLPRDLIIDFEKDFFDAGLTKEDFIPGFLELGNINGKQYMIPLMGEVMYIVVRKDLMKEAGLVDASGKVIPAKTWDELYEYAKKLTKKENGVTTQLGLGIDWGYDFIPYTYLACIQALNGTIYEKGTNKVDFVSANAKKLVEVWSRLVKDGYSSKDVFADTNAVRTNFKSGNVAMHLTAHSRLNEYADLLGKDKISIMAIPGSAQNGSVAFIHGMTIPKSSPNQKAAIAFIKERLMDKDFQVWTLNKFGKLPVLKRNYEGLESPEWQEILAAASVAKTAPLYKDWAKLQKQMQIEFQNGISGAQSVDQTLANLKKTIDTIDISTGLN